MAIVLVLLRLQALIDAEISACIKVTTNTGAIYDMQCSPQGFLLKYRIFVLLSAYLLISACILFFCHKHSLLGAFHV